VEALKFQKDLLIKDIEGVRARVIQQVVHHEAKVLQRISASVTYPYIPTRLALDSIFTDHIS
jgi:hypothetical protein